MPTTGIPPYPEPDPTPPPCEEACCDCCMEDASAFPVRSLASPLSVTDPYGEQATIDDTTCTGAERSAIQAALTLALDRLKRNPGCFDEMRNASRECRSQLQECITSALDRMTIKCGFIGQGKCHEGNPRPKGVTDSRCAKLKSDGAKGEIWPTPPALGPPQKCDPCKHPIAVANNCQACDINGPYGAFTTWLCRSQPGNKILLDAVLLAELLVHEASHNCVGGHDTTSIPVPGGKQDKCERPDSADIEEAFKKCK